MRADLAAAMLHRPGVLFLDEPTIGLDVVAKGRIREFLTRLNENEGMTILLTTHDLRDIEELCDRVMVINHGALVYDGDLSHLRDRAGLLTVLKVTYSAMPSGIQAGQHLDPSGRLSTLPHNGAWVVTHVDTLNRTVEVAFDRTKSTAPVVLMAMQGLGEVRDVSLTEPLIDDIIKRLMEVARADDSSWSGSDNRFDQHRGVRPCGQTKLQARLAGPRIPVVWAYPAETRSLGTTIAGRWKEWKYAFLTPRSPNALRGIPASAKTVYIAS